MATAGKITVVEVEELLSVGELDPDQIHTPGIYVNRIVKGQGRMLVRKSGTEPKIRIMCESNNKSLISKCINIVKKTLK